MTLGVIGDIDEYFFTTLPDSTDEVLPPPPPLLLDELDVAAGTEEPAYVENPRVVGIVQVEVPALVSVATFAPSDVTLLQLFPSSSHLKSESVVPSIVMFIEVSPILWASASHTVLFIPTKVTPLLEPDLNPEEKSKLLFVAMAEAGRSIAQFAPLGWNFIVTLVKFV
jgi:hypothetical protein